MSEASLTHEFQYSSARHQQKSPISGMWLFLATEVLFFGALFLAWIYCRHWNPSGFDAGVRSHLWNENIELCSDLAINCENMS